MDQHNADWFSDLLGRDFNENPPVHGNGMEVDDDEENDDFYGENEESEAQAGAANTHEAEQVESKPAVQSTTTPRQFNINTVNVQGKTESQLRADFLRAKLLASRKTPQSLSRSNTPVKNLQRGETPTKGPVQRIASVPTTVQQLPPSNNTTNTRQNSMNMNTNINVDGDGGGGDGEDEPAGEMLDLDALLDEGKARADAKSAAIAADAAIHTSTDPLTNGHNNNNNQHHHHHQNHVKKEVAMNTNTNMNMNMNKPLPIAKEQAQPTPFRVRPTEPAQPPSNLSDAYYVDLSTWLEMTGFHDVEFRNSKLSAYKERKSLEEEAARIAERLEKLRQLEQESVQSLRFGTPKPVAAMAPPPLPKIMTTEKSNINGTKRAHSPDPHSASKRREENGFHIRGAKESPTAARPSPAANRRQSPSPPGFNRRITYPNPRRRDDEEHRSRDPSLERRQSYYRRDPDDFDRRGPQLDYAGRDYDGYRPRDAPRLGFSATNVAPKNRTASSVPASQYRGSANADLQRGGQFFSRD